MIDSRESAFRERVIEVLGALEELMPDMGVLVELWRASVVDHSGYADEQVEVWVKLGEAIQGFRIRKEQRWFDKEVGIVTQTFDWLLLPDGLGLTTGDHVIIEGNAYLISKSTQEAGIFRAEIDQNKSLFVRPRRTDPVYRQLSMKACIV